MKTANAELAELLQEMVDIVEEVRGIPAADDPECEDCRDELCGNSWCREFGCIPDKIKAARAAIAREADNR